MWLYLEVIIFNKIRGCIIILQSKTVISLLLVLLLLTGCSQDVKIVKEPIQKDSKPNEMTEDEKKEKADEVTADEDNIEFYVYFDENTTEKFKEAAANKDYLFNPFITADGQAIYIQDTYFKGNNLTINSITHFLEEEYSLLAIDEEKNYLLNEKPTGIKLTRDEKVFLDNLYSMNTIDCIVNPSSDIQTSSFLEATEENFKETKEMIDIYGSPEVFVQQTLEHFNRCEMNVLGFDEDNREYDYLKLSNEEIDEGIDNATQFLHEKNDFLEKSIDPFPLDEYSTWYILSLNEKLSANIEKQIFLKNTEENFTDLINFTREYIKWSGYPANATDTSQDEEFYNDYLTRYDEELVMLKEEENYLLEIASKMKENGLEDLLE